MRFFRPDRPWRYRVAIVVSVTLAAILGGRQLWPRTEEQKVRDVVEEMIEAELDGDYDDVWDCLSWHQRTTWEIIHENLSEASPVDPEFEWYWEYQEKLFGRDRQDILDMGPRELYAAFREAAQETFEKVTLREEEVTLREEFDYECLEVEVVGDQAIATLRWPEPDRIYLFLQKEKGDWRFSNASKTKEMRFRILERKMAAFLPKGAVDPRSVNLVVEVGPTGVDPLALSVARARVREMAGGGEYAPTAVIDASPDVSWRDYVRVYDALVLEGVVDVRFAASGEGEYEPGVRVLAPPHPSIDRILRVVGPR